MLSSRDVEHFYDTLRVFRFYAFDISLCNAFLRNIETPFSYIIIIRLKI